MRLALGRTLVDLDTCQALRDSETQSLTQAEIALLRYLADASPKTVTRMTLQVEALGYAERARTRAVDHAIARLRRKIEEDPTAPQFLVSVRGIGYRLILPDQAPKVEGSQLIGRQQELTLLTNLPSGVHLLHGPGGVGKSTLGRTLCRIHPDSEFVPLAHVASLPQALDALGQALSIPLRGGIATHAHQIRARLQRRPPTWLVIDNVEQLPDAALQEIVSTVHQSGQRTLLTSRRRIDAVVTSNIALGPLLPDAARTLYETRAAQRVPGWRLEPTDEDALRQFLDSVDHLPLAIELAASRVQLLAPQDLLQRESRMLKLRGHATTHVSSSLDACIDMSWELLEPDVRHAWTAATVFEGGFDVQAFEAVSGVDEALEALQTLVDHGLLTVDPDAPGPRRFHWMVALRHFARNKLRELGLEEACRGRHLAYFAEKVGQMSRTLERTGDLTWPLRERSNLRSAVRWGLEHDHERGCGVLRMLEVIFQDRGPGTERLELFDQALAHLPLDAPLQRRCWLESRRALALLGVGRRKQALTASNQCVQKIDQLDDPEDRALCWMAHGALQLHLGDLRAAADAMNRCADQGREAGNRFLTGMSAYNLAFAQYGLGEKQAALQNAQRALAELDVAGAPRMVTAALTLLATVQQSQGDLSAALTTLESAAADAVQGGLIWLDNRTTFAQLLLRIGQPQDALNQSEPLVEEAYALHLPGMQADLLDLRSLAHLELGDVDQARTSANMALQLHLQLGRTDEERRTREFLSSLNQRP